MKHKNCEGCYTNNTDVKCILQSRNQLDLILKCPCNKCLIKGMCDNPCEEYTAIILNPK